MGSKNTAVSVPLQSSTKKREFTVVSSHGEGNFPLEVLMLLDVLSRIEARRQVRLRAMGRG